MQSLGFINAGLPFTMFENKTLGFIVNLMGFIKCCITIKRGDIIVIQYPLKKYYSVLCRWSRFRRAKTITLIHDLGCFRRKRLSQTQQIERLNLSDHIIASNPAMKQWLMEHGCKPSVSSLGIWDYISSSIPVSRPKFTHTLLWAGGISHRRNSFFESVGSCLKTIKIHIFSASFPAEGIQNPEAFLIHGFENADSLIKGAPGDYGLVWDGESIDSCKGPWGEYMAYNTPHKISFYLLCGKPIIIWKDAALAPLIISEGLGIAIDSLRNLESNLAQVTQEDYNVMCRNVVAFASRLRKGEFLKKALTNAINQIL